MAWESVGSTNTGEMPNDRAWILFSLDLAKQYVILVCGDPPDGAKLEVMWHDHELGSYPSLGVWSDYDAPWEYINSCERALDVINKSVEWYQLKCHWEDQFEDDHETDEDEPEDDGGDPDSHSDSREAITVFMERAHHCAMQLLENAAYVEKELPNLNLPEERKQKISAIFQQLISTKHDVISELSELDDFMDNAREAQKRITRIVAWVSEDIPPLHALVKELEAESEIRRESGLAYMLVAESASNILRAFVEMGDTADAYLGQFTAEPST